MKTQEIDHIQIEGETHERDDHEVSDQYSSSESSTNIAISSQKNKNYNGETKAVSSRPKRKRKLFSSMRSGFVDAENKMEMDVQQKLQELSWVVPGLEMKDENLMIDDVIDFLKRLQERTNILKEQNKNISVHKAWVFGDNEIGQSSSSSSVYQFKQGLPEIEAKAQGKNVLIRVHCENQQGYLAKVIGEIEKLHLNIDNISSLPFGDCFMDITITAQVSNDELFMTMKDLKKELREALQLFM